jgi:hypothetical protein
VTADPFAGWRRLTSAARFEVVAQSGHPDRRVCTHLLGPVAEACRNHRERSRRADVPEGVHYTTRRIEKQHADQETEVAP